MPITGQPYFAARSMTLHDLLGERLREAAAEDREVLREDEDLAAEDRPVAGHDRVAVRPPLHHPEERVAMANEPVELDERARVEQLLDPLAGEHLPLLVLSRDGLLATGMLRLLAKLSQLLELPLGRFVCWWPRRRSLDSAPLRLPR